MVRLFIQFKTSIPIAQTPKTSEEDTSERNY
jgi:hypothetical protein